MNAEKEKKITKLAVALAPFAALDIHHLRGQPDDRPIWQLDETTITVGDIRRAKQALGMMP
jgi:hypothetical protein